MINDGLFWINPVDFLKTSRNKTKENIRGKFIIHLQGILIQKIRLNLKERINVQCFEH